MSLPIDPVASDPPKPPTTTAPGTLGELLAHLERRDNDVAPYLRRVLHGTDTEPGLVARVTKAAQGGEDYEQSNWPSLDAWHEALWAEIAQNVEGE